MAQLAELEARMMVLEDIEAIKRLKYKYFRCLDSKLWDDLAKCFTEDATTSYAGGKYSRQGVDAIMKFLKKGLGQDHVVAIHQGHHPEIEITTDTTAKGIWALYGYRIDRREKKGFWHAASYHDEYVKQQGEWKIRSTGYTNILEENWDIAETGIQTS